MWRSMLLVVVLLFPAATVAAQGSEFTTRVMQVDTAQYPNVTVHVAVTNAAGQPVAGLTERDITLREDGQPVAVSAFSGGGVPMAAVLVIDRSGSMDEAGKIAGARRAAQAFIEQLRPTDSAALIAFDRAPELLQPFTSDQAALTKATRQLQAGGPTALYDSVMTGVDLLQTVDGRRTLLVMTDGQDRISATRSLQASQHSLDEAIAHANAKGIAVQVIGLGERNTDHPSDGIDETVLERIANETGGQYFYTPDAEMLAGMYRNLAVATQQEYQITYRSPRPAYDGTRRDIDVQVVGAASTTSRYVEPHLINVRSTTPVALVLLLVLLGLLLLPLTLRRRTRRPPAEAQQVAVTTDGETVALGANYCDQCGTALRPSARFCTICGAPVLPVAKG